MRRFLLIFVAAVLATLVTAQSSADHDGWAPAGKWTVDFVNGQCILLRPLAAGQETLTFTVQQLITGPTRLSFSSPGAAGLDNVDKGKVVVRLLPSGEAFSFTAPQGVAEGGPGSSLDLWAGDPAFREAFAKSDGLELTPKNGRIRRVSFGSAAAASTALQTCEDDQLTGYGLDPKSVVRLALDQLQNIVSGTPEYPSDAQRAGAQGPVLVAAGIDQAGNMTRCNVLETSGHPSLDRATCASLYRKLRLEPLKQGVELRWAIVKMNWALSAPDPRSGKPET